MNCDATHQKDMAIIIDQALQSYEQYGRTATAKFLLRQGVPLGVIARILGPHHVRCTISRTVSRREHLDVVASDMQGTMRQQRIPDTFQLDHLGQYDRFVVSRTALFILRHRNVALVSKKRLNHVIKIIQ